MISLFLLQMTLEVIIWLINGGKNRISILMLFLNVYIADNIRKIPNP